MYVSLFKSKTKRVKGSRSDDPASSQLITRCKLIRSKLAISGRLV